MQLDEFWFTVLYKLFFLHKMAKKGCCSYYYYVTLFVLNDFNECLCLPELSILFPEFFFACRLRTDGRTGRKVW